MSLRNRLRNARARAGHLLPEHVVLIKNGEEIVCADDPLDIVVEEWQAGVEGRPAEHLIYRGWRLKDPESVEDPLWRTLGASPGAEREGGE